jgi:glycosyltransferase involved in cell wall biosynthesis
MRGLLANYGITTPIRVIPTGVDIPAIQTQDPGRARERFGISTAAPFLLYVGRVGKEKGLDFLLRAFAFVRRELPEARLVISGGGTERRHMVAYAGALGLASSVTFTGYLQRQELFELYATADVFVFSSRTETQGLVLVEALAVGTPVVAVRAMGVSEVLDRERGGLLTTPREDDFARAVLRVLREPDLRKQKSREARERAQELSAAQMAASVEKEFAALLRARLQSRTFSDGTKHPAA